MRALLSSGVGVAIKKAHKEVVEFFAGFSLEA